MPAAGTVSRLAAVSVLSLLVALSPAAADVRIEKNLALAPGGKLVLETDAGSVTVTGGAATGANVVITSRNDDLEKWFKLDFKEEAGTVRITGKQEPRASVRSVSLHYEIKVPTSTSVDVDTAGGAIRIASLQGTATLETSGGSIRIEDFAGDPKAHSSGGGISLANVKGSARVATSGGSIEATSVTGTLVGKTSGGSIEVSDVGGDAEMRTSGGSIRVTGAGGKVIAATSGGGIEVAFVKGNARGGDLDTSAGGVLVRLDPSIGLTLDAGTSVGRIHSDLPIRLTGGADPSSLVGTIGGGGETLRVRTSAGSIRIEGLK